MKELRGEGKYCNNKSTLTLPLCQGHPALCDLVCLSLYVSFFLHAGPLYPSDPPLFSHSFFPLLLSLRLRYHTDRTVNVRLSHGAPFLILTRHQSETPTTAAAAIHTQPNTQLCFSGSRRVGEHLLYHWGYEKTCVDLRG